MGTVMVSARKGPGRMLPPQLEKLPFPLFLNDFLLQNVAMALKGVVWRKLEFH